MTKYTGARVVARQLFEGYAVALDRFQSAMRDPEPDPGFRALFESLNWAVAIEDFIREVWVPNGKPLDWGWRAFAGGEELPELLNATRYARNLVYHHWADVLRRDEGFRAPIRSPLVSHSWVWRNADELPDHPDAHRKQVIMNREAYSRRLAGDRADNTLLALGDAFAHVGTFVDPPRPARRKRPDAVLDRAEQPN
jgi:hypothetical protein